MDLTIIIVNWNGGDLLRECLRSLVCLHPPFGLHVVVVDNNSHDGSPEMVGEEFPGVQLIRSRDNVGFGRGNNLARSRVQTPAVLFLNPDTLVPHGAVEAMMGVLEQHNDIGAVGCRMTAPDGTVVHDLGYQWFPTPLTEFVQLALLHGPVLRMVSGILPTVNPGRDAYVSKLYGGCLLVRREVLDQVGWFDERFFMYAEDVDLCRKIAEKGWKLFYSSTVEIRHVAGGTTRQAPPCFSSLMKCQSMSQLMEKYYGKSGRLAHRLAVLAASLIRMAPISLLHVLTLGQSGERAKRVHEAEARNFAVLRWSLGLQRPVIPK